MSQNNQNENKPKSRFKDFLSGIAFTAIGAALLLLGWGVTQWMHRIYFAIYGIGALFFVGGIVTCVTAPFRKKK